MLLHRYVVNNYSAHIVVWAARQAKRIHPDLNPGPDGLKPSALPLSYESLVVGRPSPTRDAIVVHAGGAAKGQHLRKY